MPCEYTTVRPRTRTRPTAGSMEQSFDVLRDIALVMTAAGVAVAVMARLGQSAVMGYLLAGMVVGPFLLPALSVTHTEFIRRLADLGLILVLYSIGVEFGWHRFRRLGAVVIVIALAEVTILLAAGYAAARLLGWAPIDGIFLGAAISVTSSAVVVKMLRDSGRLDTPAGRLIVGTSIVEDFVAVILLTVLSGIAATGTASLVDVGELLVKIAMFAFATIVFGVLFVPRIMDIVARWGSQEASLVTSLALGFGLALVAHSLELSPAAGAFMIGAVLGDTRHARNLEQMVAPLRDVFAAVFFVSVGTLVDLTLVLAFIGPALVVTALFIVIKVLANAFATLLTGNSEDTALRVGLGMPSMGEFSVALAKTGADRGVVNPILYPVVTVTAVLTSFTYPYIFRAQDRAARFAAARSSRWVGPLTLQLRSLFGWMRLPRVARG
ncbi:MAG: cation:proton antiporter, partial [SAR202 cluster bacterium]|nr:cation:proton antiporter [SAR202 cluster bacterium]